MGRRATSRAVRRYRTGVPWVCEECAAVRCAVKSRVGFSVLRDSVCARRRRAAASLDAKCPNRRRCCPRWWSLLSVLDAAGARPW
eukprot:7386680-Prymnesium_polylepis.1